MMGLYRPRKEFKFWLCHDRHEDTRLMEYIAFLKTTRQFARVVRNGLRLMWSLHEGDTSVLFELFPHLKQQFKPDTEDLIEQFRVMLLHTKPDDAAPRAIPATVGEGVKPSIAAPAAVATAAKLPDASTIADDFLAFIQ